MEPFASNFYDSVGTDYNTTGSAFQEMTEKFHSCFTRNNEKSTLFLEDALNYFYKIRYCGSCKIDC